MTRYYVGVRAGGEPTCGDETQAVKLVTRDEAARLLNKQRDKDVLKALDDVTTPSPEAVSRVQREGARMRAVDDRKDACGS